MRYFLFTARIRKMYEFKYEFNFRTLLLCIFIIIKKDFINSFEFIFIYDKIIKISHLNKENTHKS